MIDSFRKYGYVLASPAILFWLMPIMIIWLTTGTIAQASMSLYDALELFFKGWVIWLDFAALSLPFSIPFPGAYSILGVFTVNLLARFLFRTDWAQSGLSKAGMHVTHFGVLFLMIGGLVTSATVKEGYILIPQGGSAAYISDYNQRVLVVFEGNTQIAVLPLDTFKTRTIDLGPFQITPLTQCRNCKINQRDNTQPDALPLQGMAQFMTLSPNALEDKDEANLAGLEFNVTHSDNDGHYIAFEGMPQPLQIIAKGKRYDLLLGKQQTPLPFSIDLISFEKQLYGGTNIAQNYRSDLIIRDGEVNWPVKTSMNKPLRYKGYTFYQSAFEEYQDGTVASILAVNKNQGTLFPYIALLMIGGGLIWHTIAVCFKRKRKNKATTS